MNLIEIKSDAFDTLIEENPLVFIDFWAPWCAPCLSFAKIYEAIAASYPNIIFAKINVEDSPELSQALEIRSIPHLLIIKDKVIIYSESGSMPKARLSELVEQAIHVALE